MTETQMERVERLKRAHATLGALLADPNPGLSAWTMALGDCVGEMNDIVDVTRDDLKRSLALAGDLVRELETIMGRGE